MSKYPLVVAYYTKDTPYETEAKTLRLSLEALGLEHDIQGVPNLGTWQKNTQYKARYLKDCLTRYPGRKLLYIDVDAVVVRMPDELALLNCDFGAVKYPNRVDVQSGTLYLGGTPNCHQLVDEWIKLNEKYPDTLPDGREAWDQRTLNLALGNVFLDYRQLQLEYCWICGYTGRLHPRMSPIIVHTRGAFRLKGEIDEVEGDIIPWAVFPTVNLDNAKKITRLWHDWGYKICILVEESMQKVNTIGADKVITQPKWAGFPAAANLLCRSVDSDVVVVIGDDIHPHPQATGPVLARQFLARFPDTMGVMQPIGDRYGSIMKCAVSPWIGRKFIEKTYSGNGPYYTGYYHYFSDQELQDVATKLGCFYQDRSIVQYHDHWQRKNRTRPSYLMTAKDKWENDRKTYLTRKQEGYPGHELCN